VCQFFRGLGKESNKPKRIHQSTGKIMISPDNARGALIKEKDDDLGNYVLEVCECSTHVGKESLFFLIVILFIH
jgi:hypothetical protein